MIDREKVIKGLHCRGQDLMIDLPACDQCDYQIQMVNRNGCDFRQLCRDAIALLKEQEVVRCKDCIFWQDNNDGYPHHDCKWREDETPDPDDYCSVGERKKGR